LDEFQNDPEKRGGRGPVYNPFALLATGNQPGMPKSDIFCFIGNGKTVSRKAET